jgi:hypothetical protein
MWDATQRGPPPDLGQLSRHAADEDWAQARADGDKRGRPLVPAPFGQDLDGGTDEVVRYLLVLPARIEKLAQARAIAKIGEVGDGAARRRLVFGRDAPRQWHPQRR